ANNADGIVSIRPNERRNLIAGNTRNLETATMLLRMTSLCGIKVTPYEPRTTNMAVSVIHGLANDLTEADLLREIMSSPAVLRVRSMGSTNSAA
ncbi:hypothetical protein HPB47_025572, partial [Ixodes persulcatus]